MTISLEQSTYVVNEDAVTASVCAVIVNDVELARDVIVNLLTLDGTALSEGTWTHAYLHHLGHVP